MEFMMLFPNEASFYERMGMEIYENYNRQVKELYRKCKKYSNIDLTQTLIYENKRIEWDETTKMIAVLVTSVAYYQVWKSVYTYEPKYLTGYGLGYLSALVCAGTISLRTAIYIIKNKKIYGLYFRNIADRVLAPSNGYILKAKRDILSEIQWCKENRPDMCAYVSYAEKNKINRVFEIGPNNLLSKSLCKCSPGIISGYFDISGDNNYVLESFEYKKLFNLYYCVLRILGILVSTKNRNDNIIGYEENVIVAYQTVKSIVDSSTKILLQTGEVNITEEDFNKCMEMLKVNFLYKHTPEEEIIERIKILESETMIRLKDKFADVVNLDKVR